MWKITIAIVWFVFKEFLTGMQFILENPETKQTKEFCLFIVWCKFMTNLLAPRLHQAVLKSLWIYNEAIIYDLSEPRTMRSALSKEVLGWRPMPQSDSQWFMFNSRQPDMTTCSPSPPHLFSRHSVFDDLPLHLVLELIWSRLDHWIQTNNRNNNFGCDTL